MSRIRRAFENRFRALLERAGARRLEQGVRTLFALADRRSARMGITQTQALAHLAQDLSDKCIPFRKRPAPPGLPDPGAVVFCCDSGMGGLARWLRAAGHHAIWQPRIADRDLLEQAIQRRAAVLTTDSFLMDRRIIRDGRIPALWLPPALAVAEQLGLVFRHFNLSIHDPRCMACGGELRMGDKEALRDRIPPRTYRWLDQYFVCVECGQLFWRGTHWQKISQQLLHLAVPPPYRDSATRYS